MPIAPGDRKVTTRYSLSGEFTTRTYLAACTSWQNSCRWEDVTNGGYYAPPPNLSLSDALGYETDRIAGQTLFAAIFGGHRYGGYGRGGHGYSRGNTDYGAGHYGWQHH
jgi:hypothetical protein